MKSGPAVRRIIPGALIALATLYLPPLIPWLGVGPLTECSHCVRTYCAWYPLVPTAVMAMIVGPGEFGMVAVASVVALMWLIGIWLAVRSGGRAIAVLVALASAILSAVFSLWFGALVRM